MTEEISVSGSTDTGEEMSEVDIASNIYVNTNINTLASEDFIFERIRESYGKNTKIFEEIIEERETYENPSYPDEREILRIYDLISQFSDDEKLAEALYLTCLWKCEKSACSIEGPQTFTTKDDRGKVQIKWDKLTDYILDKYVMITWSNIRYIYIGSKFYEDSQGKYKKDIITRLKGEGVTDGRKVEDVIREVNVRLAPLTTKYDDFPFNLWSSKLIPVKNGVIHRKTGILLPHSPAFGFTYCLPVVFDPTADSTNIRKYIDTLMEKPDDREILIQIPAHALMAQDKEYSMSYSLIGSGSNGKSTYIRLLRRLIGDHNVCAISLQEITGDRFKVAELHGKLMNLYPDLPSHDVKSVGAFKAATGGDIITVEKKFSHPFQMQNHAVMVFSANKLPCVNDDSDAFWRRWCILEFNAKFPVNPEFDNEIFTDANMSGFLNLVLSEMKLIETRKGLRKNDKADVMKEAWKTSSNSVYAYIKSGKWEHGERHNSEHKIKRDELYNDYLTFCKDNDMKENTKRSFTEQIMIEFKCEEKKILVDRVQITYINGIKLKEG